MAIKEKYEWSYEDGVRYVYGELKDPHIIKFIEEAIDKSDNEVLEVLSGIRMMMGIRQFKTADEHITTLQEETTDTLKKAMNIYENLSFESSDKKPLNTLRYILSGFLIITILGVTLYFTVFQSKQEPVEEEKEQSEAPPMASAQDLATQYLESEKPDLYPQTMGIEEDKEKLGIAYRKGDYTTVIDILENNSKVKIEADRKALVLGISYNRLGQSDKSVNILEKINTESSYWDNAQWELGLALIAKQELIKAKRHYLKFEEITKNQKYLNKIEKILYQIEVLLDTVR